MTFFEYGGGTGLLCALARAAGIGTVVYNDIYNQSCQDAKVIHAGLGLAADHYVEGDVDAALRYLEERNVHCGAIASFDVIEHVYDLDDLFEKLPRFSRGGPLRIVMSSAANGFNPRIRSELLEVHRKLEHEDREPKWGQKKRDSLVAYRALREQIVRKRLEDTQSSLPEPTIKTLAERTRGLVKPLIEKAVDACVAGGSPPAQPAHPSNTCDPFTGNWGERLFDPHEFLRILERQGLRGQVRGEFCEGRYGIASRVKGRLLRLGTRHHRALGLKVAPFYSVMATRD
ncbi:MAG: hypothetical protein JKY65_33050 [Planctomycetes bacterium]|nr:hypothetical protein [Planctomycetota bacterium]